MHQQGTQVDFTGQDVFIGIDVGKRRWDVRILVNELYHKKFSQDPDPEQLVRYLYRQFPGARYHAVYEAGYCGFWIHTRLRALGVNCIVINPADVPTSDKERVHKNNSVDAGKLARNLRNKELKALYVPARAALEDRTLVRMRMMFVRKQTRCKNQIKALLQYYGYHVPEDLTERYWSRSYIRWIEGLLMEQASGQYALQALLNELTFLRHQLLTFTRQIRTVAQQEHYRANVALLCTVPGIAMLTAMTLLTELMDIGRFPSPAQLASFMGLIPGEHSTGDEVLDTGLTRRRNAFLRYLMIESAWIAVREDPALMQAFLTLSKRMPKTDAIIRIARKLSTRIRYVLNTRHTYVTAVMASR
jgi:transposase